MSWIKKGDGFLPNISRNKLKYLYKHEKEAKGKLRLLAAILRKNGKTLDEICFSLQKAKTTVHDWLKRIEDEGLTKIYDLKKSGKPAKLNAMQKDQLKKILSEKPIKQGIPFVIWTTQMLQYLIHKLFNVKYEIRNIEYLVKKLGFSFQKPRQRHKKTNTKKQEKFKKNFKKKLRSTFHLDSRSFALTKRTLE
jgi:transposase